MHLRSQRHREADFAATRGYADLKKAVAEVVVETVRPIRERYERFMAEPAELDRVLGAGARQARAVAEPKVTQVKARLGLVPPAA